MQKARIRLTGTDFNKVEMVCDRIREIAERTGVNLAGPIPLPTKRLVVPIRKSPDGEGTASWDRWQMRIHKRLIDIDADELDLRQLMRLNAHELTKRSFIGIDIDEAFMNTHLPAVPRGSSLPIRALADWYNQPFCWEWNRSGQIYTCAFCNLADFITDHLL